ncbi:MAG TPA: oxidative damage protection protein [Gammaproteobacteria bacterium]|nr:oxidative damage protection protein [Gammaproteobacteria bacterium]
MSRIIYCVKLQQEAEGLEVSPYPGLLGQKILQQISKQAWQMWLNHQTMLINEYRLSLIDPKAKEFLIKEMEKFLFGEGSAKPEGYIPQSL